MKLHLKILILTVLLGFFQKSYADTFIVTSNADSGPGTLREAITLANANGTAVTDYVNFNIADVSVTGRTITLHSSLILSSNLIIDGSTQAGVKFGVTDSKVKIMHGGEITLYQAMILSNVDNVEIYGLYFTGFFNKNPSAPVEIACAIYTPDIVNNLKIGAPGKGNVFYDNTIGIANRYSYSFLIGDMMSDIEIKSNFFNLNEDGVTVSFSGVYAIEIKLFKNLTIGGNTEAEGNFFAGYVDEIVHLIANNTPGNGFLNILHNSFGSDFSKTIPVKCGGVYIAGLSETGVRLPSDIAVTISKNTFNNPLITFTNSCHGMLDIYNISGFITITGNAIGNLSNFQSCQTFGIGISYCENGIIGGNNPDDYNSIGLNYINGISLHNNKNITIQKNSIYCN
ncbi:MAG: hypothetical protein JNL23_06755, partial [Chitinophagaceae bacterium]|nr:hypothetical protein [Chitinophagaceae bacterium]